MSDYKDIWRRKSGDGLAYRIDPVDGSIFIQETWVDDCPGDNPDFGKKCLKEVHIHAKAFRKLAEKVLADMEDG